MGSIAADEALLTHPPLTSCCVARFLTGCSPVLVHSPGVRNPCLEGQEGRREDIWCRKWKRRSQGLEVGG